MMRALRVGVVVVAVAVVGAVGGGAGCPTGTVKPPPTMNGQQFFHMPERALCGGVIDHVDVAGAIESDKLVEASGVVASPTHKGVLWMHNDHGDKARIFAVSTTGANLGNIDLTGVENIDFEDIAAAPCPDLAGPCIYIADTGDNERIRENAVVYAIPEPDVDPEHPLAGGTATDNVWKFPIKDVDGPFDSEAFVVLPDATAMIFYEKTTAGARIFKYAAPWTPDTVETLEVTGTFDPPGNAFGGGNLPTGADLHPSGDRLVLRTYGALWELRIGDGVTADHFGGGDLGELIVNPGSEPQGEAVAFDEDGTGLFLVSESPDLTPNQPLHHAPCD